MKLKTIVCVSALIMTSLPSFAQTKLVVRGTDGKDITTQLQKISEITFSEAGMTIVSADGKQTVPIADIVEMTFDISQTGASNASADLGDVKLALIDGRLTATAQGQIGLTVYDVKGQLVATATGDSEVSFDFQPLAKGIYIVKVNNKIIKVTR